MSEVISLTPTMTKRMGFDHPLLDDADDMKMDPSDCKTRDELILGNLWMVKDMVSRFRAHWPETRRMTDDLVSVGLEALTEYFNTKKYNFNKLNAFMMHKMRVYINDNRSTFSASKNTNMRREAEDKPLEYNYASQYNDELTGEEDYSMNYVDMLDAAERLAETDREDMHTLIMHFLNHNHQIDEESLSEEEKAAVDRLSQIGKEFL